MLLAGSPCLPLTSHLSTLVFSLSGHESLLRVTSFTGPHREKNWVIRVFWVRARLKWTQFDISLSEWKLKWNSKLHLKQFRLQSCKILSALEWLVNMIISHCIFRTENLMWRWTNASDNTLEKFLWQLFSSHSIVKAFTPPNYYFSEIISDVILERAFLVAQMVKNLPVRQKTWVWSLGQVDTLEKRMATHSSIFV